MTIQRSKDYHLFYGYPPSPLTKSENTSKLIARYIYQLLKGCGRKECSQPTCKSNFSSPAHPVFYGKSLIPSAVVSFAVNMAALRGYSGLCTELTPLVLPKHIAELINENIPIKSPILLEQSINNSSNKRTSQSSVKRGRSINSSLKQRPQQSTLDVIPESSESLLTEKTKQVSKPKKISKTSSAMVWIPVSPVSLETLRFDFTLNLKFPWIPVNDDIFKHCLNLFLFTKPIDITTANSLLPKHDPTGTKTATAVILVFSCREIWIPMTKIPPPRGNINNLEGKYISSIAIKLFPGLLTMVRYATTKLDEKYIPFFCRTLVNSIFALPAMDSFFARGRASEMASLNEKLAVKCINCILKYVQTPDLDGLNLPAAILLTLPISGEDQDNEDVFFRSIRKTWPSFSPVSSYNYLNTYISSYLSKVHSRSSPLKLLDDHQPKIFDTNKQPLSCAHSLLKIGKSDPFDTRELNYLDKVNRQISIEALFKLFKYKCYRKMVYAWTCSLTIQHSSLNTLTQLGHHGIAAMHVPRFPYNRFSLSLSVDRMDLLRSSISAVASVLLFPSSFPLHHPLKIQFGEGESEIAVDQGGVQVEFFKCLGDEMMNPECKYFEIESDSKKAWFPGNQSRNPMRYLFIGILIGLAMYNGCTVSIDMPLVFYRLLLNHAAKDIYKINPEDTLDLSLIEDLYPTIAKVFREMIKSPESIESMEIPYEFSFLPWKDVPLFIPLSSTTGYVDAKNFKTYIKHWIYLRIFYINEQRIKMLYEGLTTVIHPDWIKDFSAEELQLFVEGDRNVTVADLKRNATYDGGYLPISPIIKCFWRIVETKFTKDDLKHLLEFVTGSDRIPANRKFDFIIQKNGSNEDRIPSSSVCFSRLMLPDYKSKSKLDKMLRIAINNSSGFGLV